jgi:flagellar FliL protein
MADEANAEGGDEIQVGNRSNMPVIIGMIVVLLLGLVGGYFGQTMIAEPDPAADDKSSDGRGSDASDEAVEVDTSMIDLGSFTVNLRDSSGRVLSMKIQVETDKDEENEKKVDGRLPEMRDSILLLASDYSYTELEGIDGKYRLKDDIHTRVNAVLEPIKISRVYFTEFVVQ